MTYKAVKTLSKASSGSDEGEGRGPMKRSPSFENYGLENTSRKKAGLEKASLEGQDFWAIEPLEKEGRNLVWQIFQFSAKTFRVRKRGKS
ncbi:hypothetical protein TNCV_1476311 [Trichonephila clavipes]|nr:hypothetical protein TNCV_1476311 [Trichonephila clavipes]